jgi:gluconokinase
LCNELADYSPVCLFHSHLALSGFFGHRYPNVTIFLVIMGVAGCGKSSLGAAVAQGLSLPLIEGDDFHSPHSKSKMQQGMPLNDVDRQGWLNELGAELRRRPAGAVLTCSALKLAYRDRLRTAVPTLRFAFLDIPKADALRRVQARASSHFFSADLVDSQFATLEDPRAEMGVLRLDALLPLTPLQAQVQAWLLNPQDAL